MTPEHLNLLGLLKPPTRVAFGDLLGGCLIILAGVALIIALIVLVTLSAEMLGLTKRGREEKAQIERLHKRMARSRMNLTLIAENRMAEMCDDDESA